MVKENSPWQTRAAGAEGLLVSIIFSNGVLVLEHFWKQTETWQQNICVGLIFAKKKKAGGGMVQLYLNDYLIRSYLGCLIK